jgi:Zn-dependent M28 family amino/carboxypeptidase
MPGPDHPPLTTAFTVLLIGIASAAAAIAPLDVSMAVDIDRARFEKHVEVLASDAFEGRAPASAGEKKTIAYLTEQFAAIGLEPVGDSYLQPVPLIEITASPDTRLEVRDEQGEDVARLDYGDDVMLWTKRVEARVSLAGSDMVFVGYGIVAPEYGWNDYEGVDVAGKTVVMLINDPGFAAQDDALFRGNAMTYYGRWTYKFEEAARQGAAAALIIHETAPAAYPWEVVRNSWSGPQFDLVSENGNADRISVEGWITRRAANALFTRVGLTYTQAAGIAGNRDFRPVPLRANASVTLSNAIRQSDSFNVIGRLAGTERPDEHIAYMAHWDHLGRDVTLEGDQIFNGAVDNATGVAAVIELARAFAKADPAPERSLLFMAVTAEESGLLGSRHYAEHPLVAPAKTVAAINIDAMNVDGPTHDVVVVGFGQSELENYLREAAQAQNRRVEPEPTPERGSYFRSDHFNFASIGVPALYAESGIDYVGRAREWGIERSRDYNANRYHKPGDEYDPQRWNLDGAMQDMALYYAIGARLAGESTFPQWFEGSEFKAIRDRTGTGER